MIVGGASLFLGAGFGAVLGGVTALFGAKKLSDVEVLGSPIGGYELKIGPVSDPNFPWVILGRVVLFYRLVSERNHARRGEIVVSSEAANSFSESMNLKQKQDLSDLFKQIRSQNMIDAKGMAKLVRQIENLCK